MKRLSCLLLAILLLLTACGYELVLDENGYKQRIVFPDGTEYLWTDMSYFCVDLNPLYRESDTSMVLGSLVKDENDELYICNRNDSPEEIVILERDTVAMQDYTYMFVKDGYEMPTFETIDKIQAIYCLSYEQYINDWYKAGFSKEFLENSANISDCKAFMESVIENKTDDSLDDFDDHECVAVLVFKFDEIDDFYFSMHVYECEGLESAYFVDGIADYTIPTDLINE